MERRSWRDDSKSMLQLDAKQRTENPEATLRLGREKNTVMTKVRIAAPTLEEIGITEMTETTGADVTIGETIGEVVVEIGIAVIIETIMITVIAEEATIEIIEIIVIIVITEITEKAKTTKAEKSPEKEERLRCFLARIQSLWLRRLKSKEKSIPLEMPNQEMRSRP